MPLYKEKVAQELEGKKSEFAREISKGAVEEYQNAAEELLEDLSKEDIIAQLEKEQYPGALPTEEFEDQGMVVTFEESSDWKSHEAVNNWSRDQLQGLTTVAADGSQIDPVTEFEQPIGLVQVVWMANHHASEGESEGYTLKELDEEPGAQGKKTN